MNQRFLIQIMSGISCIFISTGVIIAQAPQFQPAKSVEIKAEDLKRFENALTELDAAFGRAHSPVEAKKGAYPPGWADAEIGRKALRWIMQYREFYTPKFIAMADKTIEMTRNRSKSIQKLVDLKKGVGTALGYISEVDGSVQPFALYLPPQADLSRPGALLVVLHGRNQTLNEISFIDAHEGKLYPKSELENGLNRFVFWNVLPSTLHCCEHTTDASLLKAII